MARFPAAGRALRPARPLRRGRPFHVGIVGLLLVVLPHPAVLHGQTVRGVVLDADGDDPVAGATIELLRSDTTLQASVRSDERGWFSLEAGSEGRYLLRPSHLSFTATGLDSVTVGRHEIVTVVLRMGRTAIPLDPLVVTARSRDRLAGFHERARQGGPGRFIPRDYIAARVTARPSELVAMTAGVRVVPGDNVHANTITMRGPAGRCAAQIFLDGLPVPQDIGMSIDDFTAADLLEGIEIHDAWTTPPPELRGISGGCGVIAFWSRREVRRPFSWRKLGLGAVLGGVLLLLTR
jgi:hypothetical protein